MFDSERNIQHQRVLCNEIRRLPNETIEQLAVRIETLVRKAFSLNTHDCKNTKMLTLTSQLRKIAIKERASHPSSIRESDLDFRKVVDKLEEAEITMKLDETENLKLQYVKIIEKTETQSTSPVQTSRHTNVRNEIAAFSAFLNTIRENFSSNVKKDLQKIFAWFINDYFTHKIDLIAQARKIFRP